MGIASHQGRVTTRLTILNLGCGVKTSSDPAVINVDWSMYLRLRRSRVLRHIAPFLLRGERRDRFKSLPSNILVHDLSKGIPFASESVDAVYHSHFLEHLDRASVEPFLLEVLRVLRIGGIHRIVVPDFEAESRSYLEHIDVCDEDPTRRAHHDRLIANLIEQCVRHEGVGTAQQPPLQRFVENSLLGDARKRGETHRWAYDRHNLAHLLTSCGYAQTEVLNHSSSGIPDWEQYGLDTAGDGTEYKPGSLYLEAVKPVTHSSTLVRHERSEPSA